MPGDSLYWEFDDRTPAFTYGPGWSNLTDTNARESTLSYTSQKTNVTIQFYGKTLWLYGAIGRTEEWNQPVSRYILDNRYVSTITAEVKNDTSYNELLVYFCDLDSSSHTLIVENTNEGATLFLDYYLVKPIPPESPRPTGTLQTGGKPFSTSITERPIYFGNNVNLSGNAAIGSLLGAVAGGILLALVIAVVAFIFWRRRGGSKPYYYQPAAAHDVLFDELKPSGSAPRKESVVSAVTPYPSPPSTADGVPQSVPLFPPTRTRTVVSRSSVYSLNSDRDSSPTSPRQTYFPLPSEYQSQKLLAGSNSNTNSRPLSHSRSLPHSQLLSHSPSKTLSHSHSASSTRSSVPSSSKEDRPLL